jgi:hypothetical protein
MIRRLLIALVIISLELGYQGIGLAINCPPQPEQTGKDWEGEVNAAIARIGPVSGGEVKTKAKTFTQDLLGRLPDAGKIYLEQMKYSTICSSLRDDKTLSESEKRKQIREYDLEIQRTKEHPSSWTKHPANAPPQSKQPSKKKASRPQSNANPPVPPLTQAEPKLPETPKSQSAVSQSPSISQHSEGANSPNIVGNQNVVVITNQPSDAKLDEIRDLLRQRGYPDNPSKLLQKYPLGYTIYDLTYVSQVIPYEKLSVLNDYEVDWSQAKVIQNTKDRIALRLPDLKRKDGTGVITGLSMGGPKKVGPLACGISRTETEGVGLCGEILVIREDGLVFLVNLMQFPPLSK